MKILKPLLYLLLAIVVVILIIAAIAGVRSAKYEIRANHETPYLHPDYSAVEKPKDAPLWQVFLLGDAGDSTLNPWHPTLALTAELASEMPNKTTVVMLGDNIYLAGFPNLDEGDTRYSPDQMLLIDTLDAQLQIAARSGAELFLVPGNHDWYAEQVDTQAEHVQGYAGRSGAKVALVPWAKGQVPSPEVVHRPGLSLVFLDSQWLIAADQTSFDDVIDELENKISEIETDYPNNTILVTAHHPLQTMGPHAQYYTSRVYAFVMELFQIFIDIDQDTHHMPYQKLINGLNDALEGNDKIIYAAGHEHSLQVFKDKQHGPKFHLVSGAANQSKVSGVGHNANTQFAVSQEGFMRLSIYPQGNFLEVFSTQQQAVIYSQWLR